MRSRFYSDTEPEWVGSCDDDYRESAREPEFDPCADDEDTPPLNQKKAINSKKEEAWLEFQAVGR